MEIHNAGFTPRRWVKYCDFYLQGGPAFKKFLNEGRGNYSFANAAGHKKGACLTSVSIERSHILVRSRACLFAPTGVLDFKLMSIIMKKISLPLIWKIDEVNFSLDFMGCLSHRIPKHYVAFWERFKHNTDSTFMRHRRMTKVHRSHDESEITNHLVFLTLRDLSWMYGKEKPGWKEHDRIFTRILKKHRRKSGWIWNSITKEMREIIEEYLPSLPSIDRISSDRAQRLNRESGESKQSNVQGYTKRALNSLGRN